MFSKRDSKKKKGFKKEAKEATLRENLLGSKIPILGLKFVQVVVAWFSLVWFIEAFLSVATIHTLELLDGKGFAAFGLLMSCSAVNHGPGLTHLCDLEHPLAGR